MHMIIEVGGASPISVVYSYRFPSNSGIAKRYKSNS